MKKILTLLLLTSLSATVTFCTKSGDGGNTDTTLLLYVVNNSNNQVTETQKNCLGAYALANSCVAGDEEKFNPGIGCSPVTIAKTEETLAKPTGSAVATADLVSASTAYYKAVATCISGAISKSITPCNLPQYKYARAPQAVSGAFASCKTVNVTYTKADNTSATLNSVDASSALVF
ncbi:MAG: hypothetical protein O9346_11940 [Leptospiraceae bacterium]|nr:hypothetical protein [Leptospiraceae bacterium]MCZ8347120.1 hypothetical protein [Leptospiraceae bacterium]